MSNNNCGYLLDVTVMELKDLILDLMNPDIGRFELYWKAREMAQRILEEVKQENIYRENGIIDCRKLHKCYIARCYETNLNSGRRMELASIKAYSSKLSRGWETNLEVTESEFMKRYLLIKELCKIMFAEVMGLKFTSRNINKFNAIDLVTTFVLFQPKIILEVIDAEGDKNYDGNNFSLSKIGQTVQIPLYQTIVGIDHIKTYCSLNDVAGNIKPFWKQEDYKRILPILETASQ